MKKLVTLVLFAVAANFTAFAQTTFQPENFRMYTKSRMVPDTIQITDPNDQYGIPYDTVVMEKEFVTDKVVNYGEKDLSLAQFQDLVLGGVVPTGARRNPSHDLYVAAIKYRIEHILGRDISTNEFRDFIQNELYTQQLTKRLLGDMDVLGWDTETFELVIVPPLDKTRSYGVYFRGELVALLDCGNPVYCVKEGAPTEDISGAPCPAPTNVTIEAQSIPVVLGDRISLIGSASGATNYEWALNGSVISNYLSVSGTAEFEQEYEFTFTAINDCGEVSTTYTFVVQSQPEAEVRYVDTGDTTIIYEGDTHIYEGDDVFYEGDTYVQADPQYEEPYYGEALYATPVTYGAPMYYEPSGLALAGFHFSLNINANIGHTHAYTCGNGQTVYIDNSTTVINNVYENDDDDEVVVIEEENEVDFNNGDSSFDPPTDDPTFDNGGSGDDGCHGCGGYAVNNDGVTETQRDRAAENGFVMSDDRVNDRTDETTRAAGNDRVAQQETEEMRSRAAENGFVMSSPAERQNDTRKSRTDVSTPSVSERPAVVANDRGDRTDVSRPSDSPTNRDYTPNRVSTDRPEVVRNDFEPANVGSNRPSTDRPVAERPTDRIYNPTNVGSTRPERENDSYAPSNLGRSETARKERTTSTRPSTDTRPPAPSSRVTDKKERGSSYVPPRPAAPNRSNATKRTRSAQPQVTPPRSTKPARATQQRSTRTRGGRGQ